MPPYCQKTVTINGKVVCIACKGGYVLDLSNNCILKVDFCSVYKNGVCTLCI